MIIYCYDAYCGWCYGFSPVIQKTERHFRGILDFEIFSGGMILPDTPRPISAIASHIRNTYSTIENHTGVRFGKDYLWHINHPLESDWFPNSEKPAIALCIIKELLPSRAFSFAADLQYALHYEGRDLCDDEAYRHLLEEYGIDASVFFEKLHDPAYKEKAYYEFALCKQLHVTGFPAVFLQVTDTRFYAAAKGYTDFNTLQTRIWNILKELRAEDQFQSV